MGIDIHEPEFIEIRSPIDRLREIWSQQPGPYNFVRQRNVVLQYPELLQYAEHAHISGWAQPLFFAFQGVVLASFLLFAANLWFTHGRGAEIEAIANLEEG